MSYVFDTFVMEDKAQYEAVIKAGNNINVNVVINKNNIWFYFFSEWGKPPLYTKYFTLP
jgi:hypothetical protein